MQESMKDMNKVEIEEELNGQIQLDAVQPLEMIYERISVTAQIEAEVQDGKGGYKKEQQFRNILKECSGKFEPKTMTAILGPSGCGKTTMLNLLSGRLESKNLQTRGTLKINGKKVKEVSAYKSLIGYVMQEDLLLATFSPKETFRFITDMRLPTKTDEEKDTLVEKMISSLGLKRCQNTYIGNQMIRGVSGGERKRTSVGVELLINPSLIFLDEPTTGLDSTTAYNLINFLNKLAEAGRTIITTIHQPSSEIFQQFDKIMLMVDGNIIYHGSAKDSMLYFNRLNMPVPVHSNPVDHYLKILNKEGIALKYIELEQKYTDEQIEKQFKQKMEILVGNYKKNFVQPQSTITNQLSTKNTSASWCTQFQLLFIRSIKNQLRNPMAVRSKIGQIIFLSVMMIILYERQAADFDNYIQNIRGSVFFFTMNCSIGAIFGALTVFSQERSTYIRERLSNTYSTTSYYFARTCSNLPFQIILPFLLLLIAYFAVHLDNSAESFFMFLGAILLCYYMSSAYGFLLSTIFTNVEVALSLAPVLFVTLMLVSGFFAPLDQVPDVYRVFEYISMFKYTYQAGIISQFHDNRESITFQGITYQIDMLGENGNFNFDEPYWLNLLLLAVLGTIIRAFSLLALHLISNPKKLVLQDPLPLTQPKQSPLGNDQGNPENQGK